AVAAALGCVNAIDNPARQAFVTEMVGRDTVTNAISLNSVTANATRVVGPAVAGLLIATVGIGICFLINAGSYVAVVTGIFLMRGDEMHLVERGQKRTGQLREGLRYVRSRPELWLPLSLMVVVASLGYNFSVILPLFSRFIFHHGAAAYGVLYSVLSVGAVISGRPEAPRGRAPQRRASLAPPVFGPA